MRVTFLGTGTSTGVPTLGCHCRVCDSSDPHDRRTRPSVMLELDSRVVVIDTTPDFRQQAMRERVERLDAVLFTHDHVDHVLGLDDVRPFYFSKMLVSPNDENKVFFLSMKLMESDDGGKTAHYADKGVHVDHHAMWIDPKDPDRIIQGNDGGVFL